MIYLYFLIQDPIEEKLKSVLELPSIECSKIFQHEAKPKLAICCRLKRDLGSEQGMIANLQQILGSNVLVEKILKCSLPIPWLIEPKEEFIFQREMISDSFYSAKMKEFFCEHGVFILEDYFRIELSPEVLRKFHLEAMSRIELIEPRYEFLMPWNNYANF
jgi:hypothetical protein